MAGVVGEDERRIALPADARTGNGACVIDNVARDCGAFGKPPQGEGRHEKDAHEHQDGQALAHVHGQSDSLLAMANSSAHSAFLATDLAAALARTSSSH